MEVVSEVTFKTFRLFRAILGNVWVILGAFEAILGQVLKIVADWSCDQSKRPQEVQNSNGNALDITLETYRSLWAILGPKMAPKWPELLSSDIENHIHRNSAPLVAVLVVT